MSTPSPLTVYVPRPTAAIAVTIHPASGIVGSPVSVTDGGPAQVRIDYEGNQYGADNIVTYADRVLHAAGRHTFAGGRGYPTVARAHVPPEELIAIGTWDSERGAVDLADEDAARALAAWLGVPEVPAVELQATGALYEDRRVLQQLRGSRDPRHREIVARLERQDQARREAITAYEARLTAPPRGRGR